MQSKSYPLKAIYSEELLESYLQLISTSTNGIKKIGIANKNLQSVFDNLSTSKLTGMLFSIKDMAELVHLMTEKPDTKSYTPMAIFAYDNALGKVLNVLEFVDLLSDETFRVKQHLDAVEERIETISEKCNRLSVLRDLLVLIDGIDDVMIDSMNTGKFIFHNLHWMQFFRYSKVLEPKMLEVLETIKSTYEGGASE